VDLFSKQFTLDFYDGVEAKHLSGRRSQDSTKELYLSLLQQGWTLPDIDGMDILFYFELLRHGNKPKTIPADTIGWL